VSPRRNGWWSRRRCLNRSVCHLVTRCTCERTIVGTACVGDRERLTLKYLHSPVDHADGRKQRLRSFLPTGPTRNPVAIYRRAVDLPFLNPATHNLVSKPIFQKILRLLRFLPNLCTCCVIFMTIRPYSPIKLQFADGNLPRKQPDRSGSSAFSEAQR
jgi:hypothetical protein